jgi:hypothetical protein
MLGRIFIFKIKMEIEVKSGGKIENIIKWYEIAPKLGSESYIHSLTNMNGKVYGGTRPNGMLFEWNGIGMGLTHGYKKLRNLGVKRTFFR